jgi:inosine/xanthosine triphosphatase
MPVVVRHGARSIMKKVVVASHNPVKARAALAGFRRMFPGQTFAVGAVSVPSGVKDQPLSDAETLQGARTRAERAREAAPTADYWVGIEGGIEELAGGMAAFAWIVVLADGSSGRGRSGTFFLPEQVARLVREGTELGEANDLVFGRENSKQDEGAIGLLTAGVVNRTQLYEHAMIMALLPLRNPDLYRAPC